MARVKNLTEAEARLADLLKELESIHSYSQEYSTELASFDGVAGSGKKALDRFSGSLTAYISAFYADVNRVRNAILDDLQKVANINAGWIDSEPDSSVQTASKTTSSTPTTENNTQNPASTNKTTTSEPSLDSLKSQINENSIGGGQTNSSDSTNDAPPIIVGFN